MLVGPRGRVNERAQLPTARRQRSFCSTMSIQTATARYEAWLANHVVLLPRDLERKHEAMRSGRFAFLRATYYRWAQKWPTVCPTLARAPRVLGVGDLHV